MAGRGWKGWISRRRAAARHRGRMTLAAGLRGALLLAAMAGLAGSAAAQNAPNPLPPPVDSWIETGPEVDVALVLAVDISFSMDMDEQALQRQGYIEALTSPPVLDAIRKGFIGRIAVTYIEWAGTQTRNIVADWSIIDGPGSAEAFAAVLRDTPIRRARRTSVNGAINFAMDQLQAAKVRPLRRVIDISGDGPNNEGPPVTIARERAMSAGVVINGLPIMLKRAGYNSPFDIENLDEYYADCVVGGPGSFMHVITERAQFGDAIRAKILREVAQSTRSDAQPAPGTPGRTDCLIGERMWRQGWGN